MVLQQLYGRQEAPSDEVVEHHEGQREVGDPPPGVGAGEAQLPGPETDRKHQGAHPRVQGAVLVQEGAHVHP